MANDKKNLFKKFKLPKDIRTELEGVAPLIEEAEAGLEVMKKLKMDVSPIEKLLKDSKEIRRVLLEETE